MKLEIKNAICGYGSKTVIKGISVKVKSGEILCLLGPNGVGKTTFFKTILGFLKLQGGEIILDGENIRNWSKKRLAKAIGYVPQAHTPPFPFSVLDVVIMGRSAHLGTFASPSKNDVAIAEESLETLGISFLKNKIYTEISGGERQMVLIARALTQQPHILIMDEPTSNLDFGNQIRVLERINSLVKKGMGVIMTTHFPDHTFLCPSKVALMQKNNIFNVGDVNDVVTEENLKSAYPWYMKIYPKIKTVSVPFDKEVNIEELIKSKPDVVVLWSGKEELQKKIEKLGIPVIIIYYDTPEELKKSVTLMGNLLGDKETKKAAEFCSYYDSNIKRITEKTSSISADNKVKVYYSAESPLSTDGNNSIVTSWIEMSGGINLAAQNGITGMSQNVPMEDVVKWNPDVIVVRDAPNKDAILKDVRFKDINAVKNNKIYINPKGVNVWCARSGDEALQVLWAAKILHPDMFEDIDMNKEVKEFYKTYYSYDVSNEELEDIMNPKK
ncbi:ATP-binding cassette domain-containing protein [Clostridium luticellarii]|uniref:Putative ABC transporter ATP-binding protein n=1 Tax=Clostridium luticellarii TaxID=1691940 RepID=A0A2T0B6Q4_9CLOT|nr:ATP-binding cassette domain-containing protein [Clostridium luticellarii]PRR79493.1 putative ABC transporter ATP-binding protein [Clostridium luticellarii]